MDLYKVNLNTQETEYLEKTTFDELYHSKGFDMRNWLCENYDIFDGDIEPYLSDMTSDGSDYKKADFHTVDDDWDFVILALRLGGITTDDVKEVIETQIYTEENLNNKIVIFVSDEYSEEVKAFMSSNNFDDETTVDISSFKVTPYLNNDDVYIAVTGAFE